MNNRNKSRTSHEICHTVQYFPNSIPSCNLLKKGFSGISVHSVSIGWDRKGLDIGNIGRLTVISSYALVPCSAKSESISTVIGKRPLILSVVRFPIFPISGFRGCAGGYEREEAIGDQFLHFRTR